MACIRYFIINTYTLELKEIKDDSWFSNPIKKLGKDNELMCRFDSFGGYQAKYSWASEHHYYVEFYVRGQLAEFTLKGWKFPKKINRCNDGTSRDGRTFNRFSFKCYMPDGIPLNVSALVNEAYIWGIMKVIGKLIDMSRSLINSFSYESNGERYIEFDSYCNIYSTPKSYPLT